MMQVLSKINAKLDQGWKMTNASCPVCQGTSLAEPIEPLQSIYCPKCDKLFPPSAIKDQENEEYLKQKPNSEQEDQTYYDSVLQNSRNSPNKTSSTVKLQRINEEQSDFDAIVAKQVMSASAKTNDMSKKIGQKLLHGWTMLNQSCHDCMAPLMKSKKGEKICFGCNRDYAKPVKIEEPPTKSKQVIRGNKERTQEKSKSKEKKEVKKDKKQHKKDEKKEDKKRLKENKIGEALVERIQEKSLTFLEQKIDKAIEDNDISQLEKMLALVFKIRHEFR